MCAKRGGSACGVARRSRAGGDGRPEAAYGASKPGRVVGCSDWTLVVLMMMMVLHGLDG